MVAGEPNLKGYHLPWEKAIIDSRIWDEEHGIFTSSPEMELVLLLVRAALKFRTRDFIRQLLGKPYPSPKSDIFREFDWLVERADVAKVRDFAIRLMSLPIANQIDEIVQKGLSNKRSFYSFRCAVLKELKPYKTYNFLGGRLYRWGREFAYRGLSFMATRFGVLFARRRVPATGGLIITFLGADGSGKSTQARDVVKWLGWKADVAFIYFGSGDGPASPLRKFVMNIKRIGSVFVKSKDNKTSSHSEKSTSTQSTPRRLFFAVWALSLALEKYRSLIKAARARNKGVIIACDRYPQNQIEGFNDGPLLAEWKNDGWLWRKLSILEKKGYAAAELLQPDIVFKLNVSERIAAQRKTDTPTHMITRKINAVQQLTFNQSCTVFEINADQQLDKVTLAIRSAIWNAL
jgi:thymidylate kinase